jgi:hypothetical protein
VSRLKENTRRVAGRCWLLFASRDCNHLPLRNGFNNGLVIDHVLLLVLMAVSVAVVTCGSHLCHKGCRSGDKADASRTHVDRGPDDCR